MEKYWVSKVKQLAALHDLKIGQIPGLVGINFHTFSKNIQMGRMSSENLQKIADMNVRMWSMCADPLLCRIILLFKQVADLAYYNEEYN